LGNGVRMVIGFGLRHSFVLMFCACRAEICPALTTTRKSTGSVVSKRHVVDLHSVRQIIEREESQEQ